MYCYNYRELIVINIIKKGCFMRICNCFKENSNIDSFEERTQKCSEVVTIVSSFVAAGFTLTFSFVKYF